MQKKYVVRLTVEERGHLCDVIRTLSGTNQSVRRAQILLKADADGPGWTDVKIAEAYFCRTKTVENIRQRLVERGFEETLKQRGLLEDTLIVWCGEFGRSPDNGFRQGGETYGRDHNAKAMTMWFAGGGVAAGTTVGATDEIGEQAVDVVHPIRDVHVTLLHLLGLDDNRLTYFSGGRFKQLSQFGGKAIPELMS